MHLTPMGIVKNRFQILEYYRICSVFESVLRRAHGRDLLFFRRVQTFYSYNQHAISAKIGLGQ